MRYRLKANEKIVDGIRRLLLEQVDWIMMELTIPEGGRDLGVHNARKSCKRVRAAYRLIRDEIGYELYKQENICFRDASRQLAAARDSWVMIRTLDRLTAKFAEELPPQPFGGIRQILKENYERTLDQEIDDKTKIPSILDTMEKARRQIENLPIVHNDFNAFREGIRRVYRRGRRALHHVYAEPSSEGFHEWRKRAKYLWHQLEILEALWPDVLSQLAEALHTLSEYLGDDHDLAVLRSKVLGSATGFENEEELLLLIQLIDQERLKLEALARPLGERLYFDPPKTFTCRLEKYWQAWQIEGAESQSELIREIQTRSPVYLQLENDLLTTREMAEHLEISSDKVRDLIYQQKLPADKVGQLWVIRTDRRGLQQLTQIYDGGLFSTQDVAEFLDISPGKVRKFIKSGKLRASKLGRQWIILEDDLKNFQTE
jgi:excisionase family DNA binding protein